MIGISGGVPLLHRRFSAAASELKRIRAEVKQTAEAAGLEDPVAGDIVVAVDEACQNIIRHAYGSEAQGDIILELRRDGEALVIFLRDFAAPIAEDALRAREPDAARPGGLGVHLIRTIMDDVALLPPPDGRGNLLRMTKRIVRPSGEA